MKFWFASSLIVSNTVNVLKQDHQHTPFRNIMQKILQLKRFPNQQIPHASGIYSLPRHKNYYNRFTSNHYTKHKSNYQKL